MSSHSMPYESTEPANNGLATGNDHVAVNHIDNDRADDVATFGEVYGVDQEYNRHILQNLGPGESAGRPTYDPYSAADFREPSTGPEFDSDDDDYQHMKKTSEKTPASFPPERQIMGPPTHRPIPRLSFGQAATASHRTGSGSRPVPRTVQSSEYLRDYSVESQVNNSGRPRRGAKEFSPHYSDTAQASDNDHMEDENMEDDDDSDFEDVNHDGADKERQDGNGKLWAPKLNGNRGMGFGSIIERAKKVMQAQEYSEHFSAVEDEDEKEEEENFYPATKRRAHPAMRPEVRKPYNVPGSGKALSRHAGQKHINHINKAPEIVSSAGVTDASLQKRGLSRVGEQAMTKRANGANDPENILIVNMYENEGKAWREIAKALNENRVNLGLRPTHTANSVHNRFNRNAPILYAAEGKEFTAIKDRKEDLGGEQTFWDADLDKILVEVTQVVEQSKWKSVAKLFRLRTEIDISPLACAHRHELI